MNDSVTFTSEDRGFVYAVARRIVRSPDDAEDVTQDALLLAYRHRASFRGDSRYHTWLYRIAATTAFGHMRGRRRSRLTLLDGDRERAVFERVVDPAKTPDTLVAEAEDRAAAQRALDELAPIYRDVLIARAEASEPEVASRLGISVANVKVRAHRGRRQLRATLDRAERRAP